MTLNLLNLLKLHNNEGDQSSSDGPHRPGKVVQRPTSSSSCAATGSTGRGTKEAPGAPQSHTATDSDALRPAKPTDIKLRYAQRCSSTNEKESETYFWIMWRW